MLTKHVPHVHLAPLLMLLALLPGFGAIQQAHLSLESAFATKHVLQVHFFAANESVNGLGCSKELNGVELTSTDGLFGLAEGFGV